MATYLPDEGRIAPAARGARILDVLAKHPGFLRWWGMQPWERQADILANIAEEIELDRDPARERGLETFREPATINEEPPLEG